MSPKEAGTVLARRYVIAGLAGQGGMGEVYRAHDLRDGSMVALKLLSAAAATEGDRFQRESQLLSELDHPGIVHYIESGRTDQGEPYFAMEWLEGEDLATRLSREALTLSDSLHMLTAVASALALAHGHDVIHRDLKPSNLFLRDRDPRRPVILDFGIARRGTHAAPLTRTGAVLGTPAYMAPEQARGQRDLTKAVDVFALGCVLYECIAGRPAFAGEHLPAVLTQILFQEPPPLAELRPDLPQALLDLLQRMLAKDPHARPQHAGALQDELVAIAAQLRMAPLAGPAAHAEGAQLQTALAQLPESDSDVGPDQTSPLLPFIGRDAELAVMDQAFAACVSESRASAMLVTAQAGMGKSRLRYEFLKRLHAGSQAFLLLHGRCDRLGLGTPYSVLGGALRRLCGVQLGEGLQQRQQKIQARVQRLLPTDDAPRVVEFIGELCGVPFPDVTSPPLRAAHQNPALMAEQIAQSFVDYVAAECEQQPVILVVEDAHWIDVQSTQIIDRMLRALRDQPIWVLALSRPELDDRLPALWQERAVLRLKLSGLGKRACEKLAQGALPESLTATAREKAIVRIVEQADGNALFLEELVRAAAAGRDAEVPETVLAILDARVQAQPPGVVQLLRAASVFGDTFWPGGVGAILGDAMPAQVLNSYLNVCLERELVVQRRRGRYHGQPELRFRHALMRDAVYARLPTDARMRAHRQAADWLERMRETDALMLAEHFVLGGEPARAAVWLVRATADALDANDLEAVLERGDRAIAAGAQDVLLGRVRRKQATAAWWLSDYARCRAYAKEALAHLSVGSSDWFLAAGELAAACGRLADLDAVEAIYEQVRHAERAPEAHAAQLICLARVAFPLVQQGRPDRVRSVMRFLDAQLLGLGEYEALAIAQVCQVQAEYAQQCGLMEKAAALLQRAGEAFVTAGDRRSALTESNSLAACYAELGRIDEAEAICRRNIALSERWNTPRGAAFARFVLCYALTDSPDKASEARALAEALIDEYRAARSVRMEGISHLLLTMVLMHAGEFQSAEAEAARAAALLAPYAGIQSWALAMQARARLRLGHVEEALTLARHAYQQLVDSAGGERGRAWPPLVLLECLMAAGRTDEAREQVGTVLDRIEDRAQHISDEGVRQKFWQLRPHAETRALAVRLATASHS